MFLQGHHATTVFPLSVAARLEPFSRELSTQIRLRLTPLPCVSNRCQKALSDFLEEKRSAMPRFYFIGDEDLLEILGQASEQEQAHGTHSLVRCFCITELGSGIGNTDNHVKSEYTWS